MRLAQTLDTDFRNTWRVALGANYLYSDALKLKFGIAYDQSPVKRRRRLVSLPDNNRVWLSVGGQYCWQSLACSIYRIFSLRRSRQSITRPATSMSMGFYAAVSGSLARSTRMLSKIHRFAKKCPGDGAFFLYQTTSSACDPASIDANMTFSDKLLRTDRWNSTSCPAIEWRKL